MPREPAALSAPRARPISTRETVMRVAADVLSSGDLGYDTPISEVGLDSLSATEMVERLESVLGAKIDRAVALAAPTLRDLAAHIDANAPLARAPAERSSREDSVGARPRDVAGIEGSDAANPKRRRSAPAIAYPGRDG